MAVFILYPLDVVTGLEFIGIEKVKKYHWK